LAKKYKVCIISLGCAKNLVDTEVMCGALATEGYLLVNDLAIADIVLLNTCSFILDARLEAEEEIANALRWKRKARRGKRYIAVAGCLPQRNLEKIEKQYPNIDLFLMLDDVPKVANLLNEMINKRVKHTPKQNISQYIYDENTPRLLLTPQNFAYVKIAEGCNHGCKFCAIPAIRGKQRSRTIESVVAESKNLIGMGVRELNFIAQDTTRYGRDLGTETDIGKLLTACNQIEGDFWMRLLYTHPKYFKPEYLQIFAKLDKLVPYIDIPLQHISDKMLVAMGRGMSEAQTRKLMDKIAKTWSNVAVRTTFIVGYPGESEEDFQRLYDYVAEYKFARMGVFIFSPEEGTAAAKISEGLVPQELAQERQEKLLSLQQSISLEFNEKFNNQTTQVLVDAQVGNKKYIGRTYADAPDIDNRVHFVGTDNSFEQGIVDVQISTYTDYDLHGKQIIVENK